MQLICIVDGAFAFYTGTEKFWTITGQSRDKITTSFFFLFVLWTSDKCPEKCPENVRKMPEKISGRRRANYPRPTQRTKGTSVKPLRMTGRLPPEKKPTTAGRSHSCRPSPPPRSEVCPGWQKSHPPTAAPVQRRCRSGRRSPPDPGAVRHPSSGGCPGGLPSPPHPVAGTSPPWRRIPAACTQRTSTPAAPAATAAALPSPAPAPCRPGHSRDVAAQLHAHAFQRLHGQLRGVQLPQATQHSGSVAAAAQPRLRGDTLSKVMCRPSQATPVVRKNTSAARHARLLPVGGGSPHRRRSGRCPPLCRSPSSPYRTAPRSASPRLPRDSRRGVWPHIQRQIHLGGRQFLPLHAAPSLSLFSRGLYHKSCGNSIVRRKFVKNGQDSDPKGSESCGMTVEMPGLS